MRNLRGLGRWNALISTTALDKERSLDALDRLDGNIRERREKERDKEQTRVERKKEKGSLKVNER